MWLHIIEQYGKVLDAVEYVQTFKALRVRYEQHLDKARERDRSSLDGSVKLIKLCSRLGDSNVHDLLLQSAIDPEESSFQA